MSRNVLFLVGSLVLGEVALRDKCYKLNPISLLMSESLLIRSKHLFFLYAMWHFGRKLNVRLFKSRETVKWNSSRRGLLETTN